MYAVIDSSRPPTCCQAVRRYAAAVPSGPVSTGRCSPARPGASPCNLAKPASVGSVVTPTLSIGTFARREHHRRDRADAPIGLQRRDHVLEEVRSQIDVVVQQHYVLALAGRHAQVDGLRERMVVLERDDRHERPVAPQRLARPIGRAVVDDDHPVGERLCGEVIQAAGGQLPVVVGGYDDVDRVGHHGGGPSVSARRGPAPWAAPGC